MSTTRRAFLSAVLAAMALSSPRLAWAGRQPTAEERERIEVVLRAAGFRTWDDIEFEDGVWEVDDARGDDGREYDLKLDPHTLQIIQKKED